MVTKMHYTLLEEYSKQQYSDLLTLNNVSSEKIHINKVTIPGGKVMEEYDFWGYILEKNGVKYLLSAINDDGTEIKLKEVFPLYPEGLEDVAYRGTAYKVINKPVPAVIAPVKKMSFRELVDKFCESSHTNPDHQKLYVIFSLMQRFFRTNLRLCTPPGFGKDSMVVSLSNMVGGSGAVTNPTVAKLEYMTYLNHLVINEVSSIGKSDWALIQQFLLDTGDFKPSTFKRSRASSGVGEVIDLSNLSLSLFFNDIVEYANPEKFFDSKTDGNVKDRFVPFRLWGRYDESFELITDIDPKSFVESNFNYYKDMVSTFEYYKLNINSELKDYPKPSLKEYPERWRNNLSWIIRGLNVYSNTEREYLSLWGAVKNAIRDYQDMIKFPEYFYVLMGKMGIPESAYGKSYMLSKVKDYLLARLKSSPSDDVLRSKVKYISMIIDEPLFSNKNVMCSSFRLSTHNKELTKW